MRRIRSGKDENQAEDCMAELASVAGVSEPLHESMPEEQLVRLNRTIEGEIIPRLMMLFEQDIAETRYTDRNERLAPSATEVAEFVQLLLRHDAYVAGEYVENLRSGGMPLSTIYLSLLAPAAHHLGKLWEDDECSFTAVTIGVSRMHQVLMRFSPCFCAGRSEDAAAGFSALIVPMPGEQHTFGLFMVIEFFRRQGWNVWGGSPQSDQDLFDLLRTQSFDVIGCSVSADRHLKELPERIRLIRQHSCNPDIKVLVGGRVFSEQPELFNKVGADATATSGEGAVKIAEALVTAA
jgi:methanogenic corrinoid protein MtbC1